MRMNGSDVPKPARNKRDIENETKGGFADIACHDVELHVEVVRTCDVRSQRAVGHDRLFEIRRLISRDAYDSIDVLQSVARKILDRHDV